MLTDAGAFNGGIDPTDLTVVNGTLYFVAMAGNTDTLWTSDGTARGTVQVGPTSLIIASGEQGMVAFGGASISWAAVSSAHLPGSSGATGRPSTPPWARATWWGSAT